MRNRRNKYREDTDEIIGRSLGHIAFLLAIVSGVIWVHLLLQGRIH